MNNSTMFRGVLIKRSIHNSRIILNPNNNNNNINNIKSKWLRSLIKDTQELTKAKNIHICNGSNDEYNILIKV